MSSSGHCARRLGADLLGEDASGFPAWLQTSADEGNWHEARLKNEMRELGCQVTDEQLELRVSRSGYESVGHIDGSLLITSSLLASPLWTIHYIDSSKSDVDLQNKHLLEVKTFSFLEHQRWIAEGFDGYFKAYAAQHTMYRNALGERGISYLATKDRSGGARNLYIIGKDPLSIDDIWTKLDEVAQCVEQGDLPKREFDHDSLECRRCNVKAGCLSHLPSVNEEEVLQAAEDYVAGREQEKEGKTLKEQARDLLIAYAKRTQQDKWLARDWVVSYLHFPRESVSIRGLLQIMEREQFEQAISVAQVEEVKITAKRVEKDE
jgi:hypothetical protein